MDNNVSFAVFLLIIAAFSVTISPVFSLSCSSADACVTAAGFDQLSVNNLTDYCTNGPIKVQQAINCINQCSFTSPNSLSSVIGSINSTCGATAGCSGFIDRYLNYTQCYTSQDGILKRDVTTILNNLVNMFNSGQNPATTPSCLTFHYGRTCQNNNIQGTSTPGINLGTCSYLQTLDGTYFLSNPNLNTVLYICGSESVPTVTQTAGCSANTASNVLNNCGISCSAINSQSVSSFCSVLQSQVNCIISNSAGCTSVQATYLLPRFDSYAIVNQFLNCNISVNGVVIQSFGPLQQCSYKAVLQSCFNINLINQVPFGTVQALLNFDFSIDTLCAKSLSQSNQISQCQAAFLSCALPVAQVYSRPTTYDSSYNQGLGTFPLNIFGLNRIFSACQNNSPFHPTAICQATPQTNPRPTPTQTVKPTPAKIRTTPPKGSNYP